MANPNKFTAKEVLNKVLLDSSGNAVTANSVTSQEALNSVLDTTNNRLNMSLAGGTISGDVTISGDLTVNGNGTGTFDEIVNGTLEIQGSDGTVSGTADVDGDEFVIRNNADAGMSILAGESSGQTSSVIFGSTNDLNGANVFYDYNSKTFTVGTQHTSGILKLRSGNGTDALTIGSDQSATFSQSVDGDAYIALDNVAGAGSSTNETAALRLNLGDGSTLRGGAKITAIKEADYSTGANMDASLMFSVLQNNAYNNALFLTSAGNLGIGTSNPNVQNHIFGGSASQENILLKVQSNAVTNDGSLSTSILLANSTGLDSTHGAKIQAIRTGSGTDDLVFHTFNSSLAEAMRLGSDKSATFSGVTTIQGNNGNASHTLLKIHNNDVTSNTETGQTADIEFSFQGTTNGGSSFATKNAGAIRAGKDSDYFTSSADNMDSHLKFYTAQDNVNTLALTIDSSQQTMFHGNVELPDNTALNFGDSDDSQFFNTGSAQYFRNNSVDMDFIFQVNDGGSTQTELMRLDASVPSVNVSGVLNVSGNVTIPAGNLLYLDGGSNTYIYQESADKISFATNSGVRLSLDNNSRISLSNNDSGVNNTVFGYQAGNAIASGTNSNVLVGYQSGLALNSGDANVLIGTSAGDSMTSASSNVAIGGSALGASTDIDSAVCIGNDAMQGVATSDADGTVAIGAFSLFALTSGKKNISIGFQSQKETTIGDSNIAIGYNAMFGDNAMQNDLNIAIGSENAAGSVLAAMGGQWTSNRCEQNIAIGTGSLAGNMNDSHNNVAVGYKSLNSVTTADNNVAIGSSAGEAITTQSDNVFIGKDSGSSIDNNSVNGAVGIGYDSLKALTSGAGAVAIGYQAMDANSSGDYNTAVGYQALSTEDTGDRNTAIGYQALLNVNGANNNANTALGFQAGDGITTGTGNVCLGSETETSAGGAQGQFVIGNNCAGTANFTATFGNGSNTASLGIDGSDTSWAAASSDERLKENIETSSAGLGFINDLRPVTYNWKKAKDVDKSLPQYKDSDEPVLGYKYGEVLHGFIAQEVKQAIDNHEEISDGFKMWKLKEDGTQTVADGNLIPMLVKAVQELSARVEELEKNN